MATIATVADVLEAVETDLPDSVLLRLLDSAEQDVRIFITKDERATLPLVVWEGRYTPALGMADGSLTVRGSLFTFNYIRFEGKVTVNGEQVDYTADTEALDTDGGSDTITPVLADDTEVAAGAFVATIDSTGLILTIDTTLTTAAVSIRRILGLAQLAPSARYVQAVLDLVKEGTLYRGIKTERVGQYDATLLDYHQERGKILGRLVYQGGESLAT